MFLGHHAVGLAAKRLAPNTSLGVLMAAVLWLDLIWPIFLLLGWEQVQIQPGNTAFTPLDFVYYPYTHSLAMASLWATLFAVIYFAVGRYLRGAVVVWLGVVSHWVLDFIVHRPDLPIFPGSQKFGMGLWNHPMATVLIELTMFVLSLWVYMRVTRAKDRIGVYAFGTFAVIMVLLYLGVVTGPPPPNVKVLAIMGLLSWLIVLWAWWFDRHREARFASSSRSIAS